MAFDPDKYLEEKPAKAKGGFDPDAYLSDVGYVDPSPGITKVDVGKPTETFLNRVTDTATFGHLPHIAAAIEPAIAKGYDLVHGTNTYETLPGYTERRDYGIKRLEKEKKESPKAALAGDVAGMFTGAGFAAKLLPVAKGATVKQRLFQAGKGGAILGAAANPGDTEGKFDPGQLEERATNSLIGGVTGAAAQGALDAAGKSAQGIQNYLKGKAEEKAFKALTGAKGKAFEKALERNQVSPLGRLALDEKLVRPLSTSAGIAKKVEKARESAGEALGEIIDNAGVKGKISAKKIAEELKSNPDIASIRKTPGMEGVADRIDKMLDTLASSGDELSLREAQALRQRIDKSINFNKRVPEMTGTQSALYGMRDSIRSKMNEAVNQADEAVGLPVKNRLLEANKRYSGLAEAEKLIDKKVASDAANRSISLTDTIAAAGGMSSGNPLLGVALGAANKAGRTFGNSLMATGFDAASKVSAKVPAFAKLANDNPKVFQVIVSRAVNEMQGGSKLKPREEDPVLQDPEVSDFLQQNPSLIDSIKNETLRNQFREKIQKNDTSGAVQRKLEKRKGE